VDQVVLGDSIYTYILRKLRDDLKIQNFSSSCLSKMGNGNYYWSLSRLVVDSDIPFEQLMSNFISVVSDIVPQICKQPCPKEGKGRPRFRNSSSVFVSFVLSQTVSRQKFRIALSQKYCFRRCCCRSCSCCCCCCCTCLHCC